ncbi:hypothetical protein Q5X30_09625 [Acinetobacter baumannii]|nr:hypothetical protein [Acinetobacter baumannii]MDC4326264.1 hypothetical protein [Acinetobacter baumannii]MDO7354351.1 hypothetical protein [Acinetobacter baumannii]MDO7404681.1 hypothetical protein [Acinetobacter baumannii]
MFKVLGKAKDLKSNTDVVYCQVSPEKYLKIVGDDFQDFELQRKKENHKGYDRLKKDIEEGALLPSITLAVKHDLVEDIVKDIDDPQKLENSLSAEGGVVDILDGLQRTYILKELKDNNYEFKDGQTLLLEYWLESDLKNIVYRMIVLNSGQKAMSMRHQIDLLFATTKQTIQESVTGIELFTERDGARRTSANKYPLNNIAAAYYSFLKCSPEQDSENIVNDQIRNNEIFESSKEKINEDFETFIEILKKFKVIDNLAWQLYQDEPNIKDGHIWLGSDNVIVCFFAATGILIRNNMKDKVFLTLDRMINVLNDLIEQGAPFDYFDLVTYEDLLKGINAKKFNIGSARRKYIFLMFKEYLRSEGDFNFRACWDMAAI